MRVSGVEYKPIGDHGVLVTFGNDIDPVIHQQVSMLATYVEDHPMPGFVETVPAFASLAIFFDPFQTQYALVVRYVQEILANLTTQQSWQHVGNHFEIPVNYGEAFGPDLMDVARYHDMSVTDVIHRHTSPLYTVYAVGFMPGFAYLGGLDRTLATPRLATPRRHVSAGSVGIAAMQTGIYPSDSPGGWRIIGRTSIRLFDPDATVPSLLRVGDTVRFIAAALTHAKS